MQHAFKKDILNIFIMYLYILLFSIHMSFWLILVKKYYKSVKRHKKGTSKAKKKIIPLFLRPLFEETDAGGRFFILIFI